MRPLTVDNLKRGDQKVGIMSLTEAEMIEWIRPVLDPELNMSLVDLGLIYEAVPVSDSEVNVKMTLTSAGCPAGDYMIQSLRSRLLEHEKVEKADVEIVWEPKWNPAEMASDEVKDKLGVW